MDTHHVIKRPLHTEKSVDDMRANNQYHFEVDRRATKQDIRLAVEALFGKVHVVSVHTINLPGKPRRTGWSRGKTADRKKAIVKLRAGDTINFGY